jgi:hypothetical protein
MRPSDRGDDTNIDPFGTFAGPGGAMGRFVTSHLASSASKGREGGE